MYLHRNSYSPRSFNISQQISPLCFQVVGLYKICLKFSPSKKIRFYHRLYMKERKKIPKINNYGHFLSRRSLSKVCYNILLVNDVTHWLKKKFSKSVYSGRRITQNLKISSAQNLYFPITRVTKYYKVFTVILSILKV